MSTTPDPDDFGARQLRELEQVDLQAQLLRVDQLDAVDRLLLVVVP